MHLHSRSEPNNAAPHVHCDTAPSWHRLKHAAVRPLCHSKGSLSQHRSSGAELSCALCSRSCPDTPLAVFKRHVAGRRRTEIDQTRAETDPSASDLLCIYLSNHLQCRAACRCYFGTWERLLLQPSTGPKDRSAATYTNRVPGAGEPAAPKHGKGAALQACSWPCIATLKCTPLTPPCSLCIVLMAQTNIGA